MRVLDLAIKDLYQIVRDWKAALFLLAMPIAFTLLFGFVFSAGEEDPRLPVGVLDHDARGVLGDHLVALMAASDLIRPVVDPDWDEAALARRVAEEELAAALIIPEGYSAALREERDPAVRVIADLGSSAGDNAKNAVQAVHLRLLTAVEAAHLAVDALVEADPAQFDTAADREAAFAAALDDALAGWSDPPFRVSVRTSGAAVSSEEETAGEDNAFTHSSAGMMAQFAIAGLIGAAEVVVAERKSHTLRRMLTTAITKAQIIAGHFLAIYVMVFAQLLLLMIFGQILGVDYLHAPLASLLVVSTFAFFAAGLGMLIGALAKNEEQVIIFSMIPMFVLSGLGGAWMPLEFTPETFQTIAHFTPVTWAIQALKDITVRGLGLSAVLLPAVILLGFGVACLAVSVGLFRID
jgi:ABC transporter DrrB family efflux protein